MALDHILVLACVIALVLLCILIILFLLYILLRRIFPSERFIKLKNEEVTVRIPLDEEHAYGNSSPGFFFKPTILTIQGNEKRTGGGDNTEIKMPDADLTLNSKENCGRFPLHAAIENENPETRLHSEDKEMVLKLQHEDIVKNDYSPKEKKISECADNNASNTSRSIDKSSEKDDEEPVKARQDSNGPFRQCFVFNSSTASRIEATNLSLPGADFISSTNNFVPNSNYQETVVHQKANDCFSISHKNDSAVEASLVNKREKDENEEKTSDMSPDARQSSKEDIGKKFSEIARNFSFNPSLSQSIITACAKTTSYDSQEDSVSGVPNRPEEVEAVPNCHGENADMETKEGVGTSPPLENSGEKNVRYDSASDSTASDSNFVSNPSLLQSIINGSEKAPCHKSDVNSVSGSPNRPKEVEAVPNCHAKSADIASNEEDGTSPSLENSREKATCPDSVKNAISSDSNFAFNPSLLQSIINGCEKAVSYDSRDESISSVPNYSKEVVPNGQCKNADMEGKEEVGTSPSLENSCDKAMCDDSVCDSISSDSNFALNPSLLQSIINGCSKDMSYDSHDDSVSSVPNWPKEVAPDCRGKNGDVEATSESFGFGTNSSLFQENGYAKATSPDFDSSSVSKLVTWPLPHCASKKEFAARNNKRLRIKPMRELSDSSLAWSASSRGIQPVARPSLHFSKTEKEAIKSWKPASVVKECETHSSPSCSM